MIIGVVTSYREAMITLRVEGSDGQRRNISPVIDTGFTGYLTLPSSVISALGLSWQGYGSAMLADGSLHNFEVYSAIIVWDGKERLVEVDAADTDPLIGMGLLSGHSLSIQVKDGGMVRIEALP